MGMYSTSLEPHRNCLNRYTNKCTVRASGGRSSPDPLSSFILQLLKLLNTVTVNRLTSDISSSVGVFNHVMSHFKSSAHTIGGQNECFPILILWWKQFVCQRGSWNAPLITPLDVDTTVHRTESYWLSPSTSGYKPGDLCLTHGLRWLPLTNQKKRFKHLRTVSKPIFGGGGVVGVVLWLLEGG